MNEKDKKEYILKSWKVSNGKRITEMLKRYWKLNKIDDMLAEAKKIFDK
jgi:hypothetical protein